MFSIRGLSVACLLLVVGLQTANAQEVRASITGTVTDPSGAPVAAAAITVTNVAQNVSVSTQTNETGNFLTPFLIPGTYRLIVERQGFKRFVRENIVLQAQDRARVDVALEIGEVAQSVTVTADVSLLQTETASRSQIISNELIANIPTQGRNPFQIAWAAPGVIKTGSWRYLRSFDIAGTSNISINGSRNRDNEVLLDGISNVRSNRTVIHVPTMESVQEFKVLTNTYDAQYGRTGGGIVTIVTKSGGNRFHGNLFEYFQAEELNANQTELNRAGIPKPPMNINTFGFQLSGPVYVPRAFDGRNRLFWLLSYEGMRQRSADPGTATFPLMEWRGGDFSTLLNAQGQPVILYDPLTTDAQGNRQPFANNRIPADRISPIATEVLKYYPAPNSPGTGPARVNNYVYPSRWIGDMDQWIGRMDFVVNSSNTVFFRYGQNPFSEYRGLVFITDLNQVNPAEPTGNAPLVRNGRNWTFDWTSTLSPRMTFNLRAGLARWEETTGNRFGADFDPRQLGFDPVLVAQFTKLQFPRFDLGTYQAVGTDRLLNFTANDAYTFQPNVSLVSGRHFLKFGFEGRRYNDNAQNPGLASGRYGFTKNWTQAKALQADATSGNELATFLLGYPSSATVDRNIDPAYRGHYYALFLNDDWKVTPHLTLNLGLRWDYETPKFERHDRMVRGLDFNAASPIAGQAAGLNLRGAVLFAGVGGQSRYAFEPDKNNFQPRIGASYRLGDNWVLRGGYGLYFSGEAETGVAQGFSRQTAATVSVDGGLTPAVRTVHPFSNLPGGRLLDPIGSSLGAASFLGEGLTVNFLDRPLPYSHQYSFDIQRTLPGNLLIEAGYSGSQIRKLPLNVAQNVVPASELGRRLPTGAIDTAYYTGRVPNPMAGLIPNNAALNGATIPRQNLLYPFPQFPSLALANIPIGRQRYDALLVKATKRLSHGLTFLASYTLGKTLEQVSLLNAQDYVFSDPERTPLAKLHANELDTPHKFALVGVFDLPFGRNKPYGTSWSRPLDAALGGWQLNWNVTYMIGWVIDYPNAKQVRPGSAELPASERRFERWFNTSLWDDPATGRRVPAQEAFTLRDFPLRFGDVRVPAYDNWDLSMSKYFTLHEEVRLQFRFEMVNAFNHPWFRSMASGYNNVTSAAFGQLNPVQSNLPRFIKLALHLSW
jgi:hypothetical protein